METGFLNPIHDEEHFTSPYYNQGHVFDDSEHMLFGGELIVPEIIDYDDLWHSDLDNMGNPSGEGGTQSNELKVLFEWQHQLTHMQEPEAIKQIVPVGSKSTQEVSDMFANRIVSSSTEMTPSIDELFPLETNREFLLESATDTIDVDPLQLNEPVSPIEEKVEKEDNVIDVETVEEEFPLLMAGDLNSLLEQFEATEKVDTVQLPPPAPSPPRPTNQTIRDALPAEVIDRIKATRQNHKKMISVIPAMPSKQPGRAATRMQDAGATLSRNKLLKLVTGGSSGESVQLDHDYCTNTDTSSSSRSYYTSDSSEYPSQSSTPDATYSRLPEYCITGAPHKGTERVRNADNGSRKDSGLESGENSDEDLQSVNEVKSKVVVKSVSGLKSLNVVTENGVVVGSAPVIRNNVPMVSVLKKNNNKVSVGQKVSNPSAISSVCSTPATTSSPVNLPDKQEPSKKKKKLNLEEYRVRREERERIRSQESSRANSPIPCGTPPAQPDSTSTVSQDGVPKEKPLMFSVEVQTQTCDFIDLTASKSPNVHEKSRMDHREKRNDLKHRSYRSRRTSSSSSSSRHSDHHHSHRQRNSSKRHKRRHNSVSRMWSRSPSRSSSRSPSQTSSHSRSRSRSRDKRQKWRSRSPRNYNNRYNNSGYHSRDNNSGYHSRDNREGRGWQRSRSPVRNMHNQELSVKEKVRQVEERRVIYVGRIDEGTSKADLRKRFQEFGPIIDISVHFRERGDNYGFVTFAYKADAYKAVEHGNDDPSKPRYDLCFGGRRAFCKQRYADLDGIATNMHNQYGPVIPQQRTNESFDLLLHEVKAQMRKRSSV